MKQFSLEATDRQKEIVAATTDNTMAAAARKLGLSRGRVREVKERVERRQVRAEQVAAESKLPPLDRRLAFTTLPARVANCLMAAGFDTVGAAMSVPKRELLKLDNFGPGSMREFEAYVATATDPAE